MATQNSRFKIQEQRSAPRRLGANRNGEETDGDSKFKIQEQHSAPRRPGANRNGEETDGDSKFKIHGPRPAHRPAAPALSNNLRMLLSDGLHTFVHRSTI